MPTLPPLDPRAAALRRPKLVLRLVVAGICIGAVLILVFAKQVPLPGRVLLASMDFIVAAALWLIMRQKLDRK